MTYIDELESISDSVVRELADLANRVIEIVAPDGRGFLQEKKTEQEQLAEYLTVRGDVNNWRNWLNQAETSIIQELLVKGVPQEYIGAIQPGTIASKYAVEWSKKMEGLISGPIR